MTQQTDLAADGDADDRSDPFPRNVNDNYPMPEGVERITLLDAGRYAAYAYDLEFMWRWVITRDGEDVQDGPALSLEAARRCVAHVMAFFSQRDQGPTGTTGAIPQTI